MFHEFGDSAGRPGRQHRIARRRAAAWGGRWATWLLAVAVGLTGPAALASHATPPVAAPGAAPAADVPSVDWGDWTAGPLPLFGPAPADGALTVYLALVGPAGPEDLATRVSDPTSTDYGDYVTLAQATAQFGATPATRQAVTNAVTAAGGTVTFGPVNTYARATFSVAQAEDFFDTTFGLYNNTLANGLATGMFADFVLAPESHPTLPASLAGLVDAVAGMPTGYQPAPIAGKSPPVGAPAGALGPVVRAAPNLTPATPVRTGTPAGCPAAVAASALTPNQLAAAYGYDTLQAGGTTGKGVRMAVLEMQANADATDVTAYATCFGLAAPPFRQVNVGGPHVPNQGDIEAVLDVQVAQQVAPGLAALDLYSYNGSPGLQALGFIEQFSLPLDSAVYGQAPPDIVSVSYGSCEAQRWKGRSPIVSIIDRQTAVAVTTGMAFFVSTGDSGSSGCLANSGSDPQLSPQYPGTSPWVTAVGGTALTLTEGNDIAAEAVWNDTLYAPPYFTIAGGTGGTSSLVARPAWQQGAGVPAGATRLVPDVASFADSNPGWSWYCQALPYCAQQKPPQVGFQPVGGTSAAAPQVAAIFALLTQLAAEAGQPAPGFAAPLLYHLANTGAAGLRDVTETNNDVADMGCCDATAHWDLASGWGSLNAGELAAAVLGPPTPTDLVATSGYSTAAITFNQGVSQLPIETYEFSLDDGATWQVAWARPPPPLGGPWVATIPLPNGIGQNIRLRAVAMGGVVSPPTSPVAVTAPQGALFTPVTPLVVYDSRKAEGPLVSGQQRTVATLVPGASIPGAVAVAYNLTVTDTVGAGHLSVVPTGGTTDTSAINWSGPGQKLANASVVSSSRLLGGIFGDSSLTVAASGGATQFLVSVVGYYAPQSVTPDADVFTAVGPVRAYDSRLAGGPIASGQTRQVDVTSGGVVPPTATAVAYTLTETATVGVGHLKVSPHGTAPTVSAINWWQSGQTIANSSVVAINGGKIDVAAGGGSTQFIVDILGYYSAAADAPGGTRFTPIVPARAYDSRAVGAGGPLLGGSSRTTSVLPPGGGIPPGVRAVAFNLTETATVGSGHLTVAQGGAASPPLASTINWTASGQTIANGTLVGVRADAMTTFARGGSTQYLVDSLGYFN